MTQLEFEIYEEVEGQRRETFLQTLTTLYPEVGLLGLEEGFVEAKGHVLDEAAAPPDRDWVAELPWVKVVTYHQDLLGAENLRFRLESLMGVRQISWPKEVEDQDWNHEWKKWFRDLEAGIQVSPRFWVYPAWKKLNSEIKTGVPIWIEPGAGFGTGTHETTQLCLEALESLEVYAKTPKCLDLGTGSGILAIAATKLGWQAVAVEVDDAASENARLHFELNQAPVSLGGVVSDVLPAGAKVNLVMANILTQTLIDLEPTIAKVLHPGGALILSGFFEQDLPLLRSQYGEGSLMLKKGEWCALLWKEWRA